MSSAVRAHDQLDRRVQYFYALANLTVNTNGTNGNIIRVPIAQTSNVRTVMTQAAFNTILDGTYSSAPSSGVILRDMGKQITINDGLLDIATYRRVQVVDDDGNGFEGVSNAAYEDLYVLTWIANPNSSYPVRVARTG
jgi:hypothetical protein